MRLIDADLLKTVKEIQMGNFNSIEGIQAWVDAQPTAYDIDKVVKEVRNKTIDEFIYELKNWLEIAKKSKKVE